jgi:hypothetical protein
MIITTPEDMERIKLYSYIVEEYNSKLCEMKHAVITRLESAFVYGNGFDDVKQVHTKHDREYEFNLNLGEFQYRKKKFVNERNDICEMLNGANYPQGFSNPLLTDDEIISITIRVRIHFDGCTPRVYVYLDFGKSAELMINFISKEYSTNEFRTNLPNANDGTCNLDDAIKFMRWFYENDAFKL